MNDYYEQLMNFKGADGIKALVKKWDILSENINKRSFNAPILLPDLFVYTRPGYGNTKLLSLICEYLDSKENLMSFYGDVKFFEFRLEYCRPEEEFKELYRFMETVEVAAGFRSEYKGVIRISIDEWVDHHNEKYFLDFLQYLKLNTDYWFVVLTLSTHKENEKTKEMEAVVSMFLRTEKVTLELPSTQELVEYAADYLMKYGLELNDTAKEILIGSVDVLRSNKYFYGMHTVTDLCNDIAYSLFSGSSAVGNVITSEMLSDFSKDSEYIKRAVIKIEKKAKIGF